MSGVRVPPPLPFFFILSIAYCASKPRERRLKTGELDVLLAAATASRSAYMPTLILLAVETGMRAGELLKLNWSDWDEQKAVVHLSDTKNGRSRFVPLTPLSNQVISSLGQASDRIIPTNYEAVKSAWQ